jgi:hypothetical protein
VEPTSGRYQAAAEIEIPKVVKWGALRWKSPPEAISSGVSHNQTMDNGP